MPTIQVHAAKRFGSNYRWEGMSQFKLQPDKVADAIANAQANHLDDVFVKTDDKDVYVVSGMGVDPRVLRPGTKVVLENRAGVVMGVDKQTESLRFLSTAPAFFAALLGFFLALGSSGRGIGFASGGGAFLGLLVGLGGYQRQRELARPEHMARFAAKD